MTTVMAMTSVWPLLACGEASVKTAANALASERGQALILGHPVVGDMRCGAQVRRAGDVDLPPATPSVSGGSEPYVGRE